jgi:hypothetical protein
MKALFVTAIFSLTLCFCSEVETTYNRKAIVTNVNNEIVTVIDESDNEWDFVGNNFSIGDKVKLIMDNNHTHTIKDDVIKNVIK